MASSPRKLHVGIVGAGFAGLRCADVLLQHGHQVTIYEARNRLGGRVAQSNHLGQSVDLGPNWIHGTDGNPILTIAKETGTQLHAMDENQQIIDVDGTPLSTEDAALYGQLMWDDGLIAEAFRYSGKGANIPASESLLDFFTERAEKLFVDLSPEEAMRRRKTLLNVASMWGAYVGSPISRQSLKFYWLEECIEGENPFVAGTYEKILAHVSEPALQQAKILLEHKVTGISLRSASADTIPKPSIATADGHVESFDEVVMTAPLGWLKRNTSVFKPGLESRLAKAIDNISYGCLDKVYITFPDAFWEHAVKDKAAPEPQKLDTTNATPNVTATSAPLHQPTNGTSASSHYPGFTHWLLPQYAEATNPSQWDQQGMNLAALPSGSAHPTLLFYIYGPCSQRIADLVQKTPASSLDATLLAFFEPYYSRLPGYDAASAACVPKAVLATAWANDEFAGYGSYSNFQVGLEEGDRDIEVMREGMPEQGLWFAGEHTAPFVALGTSTGAYWSGEKVAQRIVEQCGV